MGSTDVLTPTRYWSGPDIADLSSGDLTIYIKGIAVNSDLTVECDYVAGSTSVSLRVNMTIADILAVDAGGPTPVLSASSDGLAAMLAAKQRGRRVRRLHRAASHQVQDANRRSARRPNPAGDGGVRCRGKLQRRDGGLRDRARVDTVHRTR